MDNLEKCRNDSIKMLHIVETFDILKVLKRFETKTAEKEEYE